MADRHVAIICHIEELPRYRDGKRYFGVNVITGIYDEANQGAPTANELVLLQPWLWLPPPGSQVPQLALWVSQNPDMRGAVRINGDVKILPIPDAWKLSDSLPNLLKRLGHYFDPDGIMKNHPDAFIWNPAGMPSDASDVLTIQKLLSHLSLDAAPIPQVLNLSFCFQWDPGPGQKYLIPAPHFMCGLNNSTKNVEFDPANNPVPFSNPNVGIPQTLPTTTATTTASAPTAPPHVQLDYKEIPALIPKLSATLHSNVLDLTENRAPQPGSCGQPLIHIDTLWIDGPDSTSSTTWNDWLTPLPGQLAPVFDRSRRFIDALRTWNINHTKPNGLSITQYFQNTILVMRHIAGPGVEGSEQDQLLQIVLNRLTSDSQVPKDFARAVRAYWAQQDFNAFYDTILKPALPTSLQLLPAELPDGIPLVEALEQIRHMLDDDSVVSSLILAQWEAAAGDAHATRQQPAATTPTTTPTANHSAQVTAMSFWTANKTAIQQILATLPYREILLRNNLGKAWKKITDFKANAKLSEADFVAQHIELELKNYVDHDGPQFSQWPQDVEVALEKYFSDVARDFNSRYFAANSQPAAHGANAPAIRPADAATGPSIAPNRRATTMPATSRPSTGPARLPVDESDAGDSSPTPVPHALDLQVDRICQLQNAAPGVTDEDYLRRISGVGVLVRQRKHGAQWRCLNLAEVRLLEEDGTASLLRDWALVASRIGYRDDLRQAFVSYDNQPIVTVAPLSSAPTNTKLQASVSNTKPPDFQTRRRPVNYAIVKPGKTDWAKMPSLKFGESFDFLVFARGNCGALPRELTADPATAGFHPAILDLDVINHPLARGARPLPVRGVRYLRRVPVGDVRFGLPASAGEHDNKIQDQLPAIPPETTPMARELRITGAAGESDARLFFFAENSGTLNFSSGPWKIVIGNVRPSSRTNLDGRTLAVTVCADSDDAPEMSLFAKTTFKSSPSGNVLQITKAPGNVASTVTPSLDKLPCPAFDLVIEGTLHPGQAATFNVKISAYEIGTQSKGTPVSFWGSPFTFPGPVDKLGVKINANGLVFAEPEVLVNGAPAGARTRPELLPLLLLHPWAESQESKQFKFSLRLPSCDVATWDRWVAKDGVDPEVRKQIWATYYRAADELPEDKAKLKQPHTTALKATIADPAVFRGFYIEVVPLRTWNALKSEEAIVPLPSMDNWPAQPSFANFNVPLSVVCKHVPRWNGPLPHPPLLSCQLMNDKVTATVTVDEGDLVELRVYPLIDVKYFGDSEAQPDQRFFSHFRNGRRLISREQMNNPCDWPSDRFPDKAYLFSPFRILVESATDSKPTQQEIWLAMTPHYWRRADSAIVECGLDLAKLPNDPQGGFDITHFEFVSRAEVLRQLWRPTGRPISPFPAQFTADESAYDPTFNQEKFYDINDAMRWEAEAFANRPDWDHLVNGSILSLAQRQALDSDKRPPNDPLRNRPVLFQERLLNDARSLYYRFCLQLYGRYAGLDPNPLVVSSVPLASQAPALLPPQTIWRRLLTKCAAIGTIPKPRVRFVIPLTESDVSSERAVGGSVSANVTPAQRTPGILVVLDEPWHTLGGLAETLAVEFDYVNWLYEAKSYYPQFGPDPILTSEAWSASNPVSLAEADIEGPIGHTFDTSELYPLFVASSFVVRPPDVDASKANVNDLAWYFARLRFRRRLDPELTADDDFHVNCTNNVCTVDLGNGAAPPNFALHGQIDSPPKSLTVSVSPFLAAGSSSNKESIDDLSIQFPVRDFHVIGSLLVRCTISRIDDAPPDQNEGEPPAALPPDPNNPPLPRYAVAFCVRAGANGRWRFVAQTIWVTNRLNGATIKTNPKMPFELRARRLRQSDPTQAYWVQYLPDCANALDVEFPSGPISAVVNSNPAMHNLITLDRPLFRDREQFFFHCIAVTALVEDASGLDGREYYLALFRYDEQSKGFLPLEQRNIPMLTAGRNVRFRVLRFQRRPKPENGEDALDLKALTERAFWLHVFPPENQQKQATQVAGSDADFRLVAISPPIDVTLVAASVNTEPYAPGPQTRDASPVPIRSGS